MSDLKSIQLTTATFDEVVPSSNKAVKIKPFTVGDEKILLIASESNETIQMANALRQVVGKCTTGVDANELESYDLEYLFLKIRAVSVGNISNMGIKCSSCDTPNEIPVDISKVKVHKSDEHKNLIKFNDTLAFKMKVPSLEETADLDGSSVDSIFKLITKCVSTVYYNEEAIEVNDSNRDDLENIINQLSSEQFILLRNFYETLPKLTKEIEFTCGQCGYENKLKLEGLASFF